MKAKFTGYGEHGKMHNGLARQLSDTSEAPGMPSTNSKTRQNISKQMPLSMVIRNTS